MALRWINKQDLDRDFRLARQEYDRKSIKWLSSLGERVVRYAREHGNYTDRTGNLRNSIGYVVIQNGNIVRENFGNGIPQQMARTYALEVGRERGGYKTYLVWVAGMEYAKYVEASGFDVIESSGDWVEATAQTLMEEFKRYLMSKRP
jgi:hypothetical protein